MPQMTELFLKVIFIEVINKVNCFWGAGTMNSFTSIRKMEDSQIQFLCSSGQRNEFVLCTNIYSTSMIIKVMWTRKFADRLELLFKRYDPTIGSDVDMWIRRVRHRCYRLFSSCLIFSRHRWGTIIATTLATSSQFLDFLSGELIAQGHEHSKWVTAIDFSLDGWTDGRTVIPIGS